MILSNSSGFVTRLSCSAGPAFGGMYDEIKIQHEREEFFADLIEAAYLTGQIDGERQARAYLWLANNHQCAIEKIYAVTFDNRSDS